ncbi:hypothetical protein Taro_040998 [Colocasia esculenta]|uniref:Uncharacterized protein n=1 Tax=Colocasia esculenta TaxID=4460 RepID=A0A843WW36_COLES|nr:hypothetical protein [Colocasia esculenta]
MKATFSDVAAHSFEFYCGGSHADPRREREKRGEGRRGRKVSTPVWPKKGNPFVPDGASLKPAQTRCPPLLPHWLVDFGEKERGFPPPQLAACCCCCCCCIQVLHRKAGEDRRGKNKKTLSHRPNRLDRDPTAVGWIDRREEVEEAGELVGEY